jgi:hypothetical protein
VLPYVCAGQISLSSRKVWSRWEASALSGATLASGADGVGLCSDLGADEVNISTSFQQFGGMSTYPVAEPFTAMLE